MVKEFTDRIKSGINETRKQLTERATALGQKAEPLWKDVRGRVEGVVLGARTQIDRMQAVEKLRGVFDKLRARN
jgi:hypothetical protein